MPGNALPHVNTLRFKLVDYITMGYLVAVTFLIVFFRARIEAWPQYVFWHALYCCAILGLVWAYSRWPERRWILFFRHTYPLLTLGFVYKSIEGYVLIFHTQYLDPLINQFEKAVFGNYPSLLLEKIVSRPVTEYFYMNYFLYYFYFAVPSLVLFLQKRYLDLERFIFTLMTAFYFAYVGFLVFPVEGPIFSLRGVFAIPHLQGYVFAPLQDFLMAHGDPHGTCYPSSHVAVCWVSLFSIRRAFGRRIFWIIFPFALSLTVAVVYNRFHYVSDVLAGWVSAYICLQLSRFIYTQHVRAETASEI
ncbi:phosphatase PAP2 family protein [candidate division FCPU426 bacterium]|nr:phosphatase PAP2 family protein [candidate division FCPU426 bacterium]